VVGVEAWLRPPPPRPALPDDRVLVRARKQFMVTVTGDLERDGRGAIVTANLGVACAMGAPIRAGEVCAVPEDAATLLEQRGFAERVPA